VADRPYAIDVLATSLAIGDPRRDNLVDYMVFARNVESLSDDDLLFEYNELNLGGVPAITDALAMHRRWAADVLEIARSSPPLSTMV
jgi:hypothetical protein